MAHWDLCGPFMTLIGNGPIGLIPINVKVQENSFTGHVGKYTWNQTVVSLCIANVPLQNTMLNQY